ncbi:MAG: c-type cytochrome [Bacteroidales bacterium]|nr:c-type cytochrome [Bacteroidales bacterium]
MAVTMNHLIRIAGVLFLAHLPASVWGQPVPETPRGALSPQEELATFDVSPGFTVSLAASEPNVVDPVAMCFDEKGRLFVCEMRGYPNGGVGTGKESRGQIRCLTDRDGDGVFETAHTFADGLRFPMGVTPWRGGLLVAVAPDILYLEDTDNDGKADRSTVLYTDFNLANIQQMVNGLRWGLDNHIHGLGGSNAGTITSPQAPKMPPLRLGSRGFRFNPDRPGSLDPMSGGGQYVITEDNAGHWFTATNGTHIRQIVLPDQYLRRNPRAPIAGVVADISDHGTSCQLFRRSPFEAWRVERTNRRAGSPNASRYQSTELVAGGYSSSTCSPLLYLADLFPADYRGSMFVCDPGNNLVHRDTLEPASSTFLARRGEANREFLASTDTWFRPVDLELGPDGAIYLLDFYREAIETPLSLPDDIKAKLNLESRNRGRIWRIAPTGFRPGKLPNFQEMKTDQLVNKLADANQTVRLMAHRLLFERADPQTVPLLTEAVSRLQNNPGLANGLFLLDHAAALRDEQILAALADPLSSNRIVALRLAESRLEQNAAIRAACIALARDPSPLVRFQVALTAGLLPADARGAVLAQLLATTPSDVWLQSAILISSAQGERELLKAVVAQADTPARAATLRAFVMKLVSSAVARADAATRSAILKQVAESAEAHGLQRAQLEGVCVGMTRPQFVNWLAHPAASDQKTAQQITDLLKQEATALANPKTSATRKAAAIRLLAYAPSAIAIPVLGPLLTPLSSPDVQLATVRSLGSHTDEKATATLLKAWSEAGPALRRELLEQLLATEVRTTAFLNAIEAGQVRAVEVEPLRVLQLKGHRSPTLRKRAEKLFAKEVKADRKKVIDQYSSVAELTANSTRGRMVFEKQCATCHRLDGIGKEVGPNLLAVVPGKSTEDLLVSLLDPNREVDPRYVNYLLNSVDGRVLTGIVVADTPGSITLRRADAAEDSVRREDIETLKATGVSLMPEGLEKTLPPQDVADLFAFLRATVAKSKPAPPAKP